MPLGIVAPFIYQGRSLNFLLDPFGEHEEIETVGHGNDRPHLPSSVYARPSPRHADGLLGAHEGE